MDVRAVGRLLGIYLVAALIVVPVGGCKIGPVTIEPPDWFGTKAREDAERKRNEPMNQLYRQGYGFNNPNFERRKEGLPLQNFDGSIDKAGVNKQ